MGIDKKKIHFEEEFKQTPEGIEALEEIKRIRASVPDDFIEVALRKEREERVKNQKFLIENIWPEGEVHLLSGSSGVGKTRWLLPTIKDWSEGKPVMGFKSNPRPYLYIACDSSDSALQRRLMALKLQNWPISAISVTRLGRPPYNLKPHTVELKELINIFPDREVFFIEAINWFYKEKSASNVKGYVEDLHFWGRVRDYMCDEGRTVVAVTHEGKLKGGEKYQNIRERAHGGVAQPAICSCVMAMEKDPKDPSKRLIHVSPRDYPEFTAVYILSESTGLLVFDSILEESGDIKKKESEDTAFVLLDRNLDATKPGESIYASTILTWMRALDLGKTTVYRWLETRIKDGKLLRIQKGEYKVRPKN